MKLQTNPLWLLLAGLLLAGCATRTTRDDANASLVGAWRSKVQFTNGAFGAVNDLEFIYVFNAGGTMTESSNYNGAPPVPPAYGVWRPTGPREFEAKFVFYSTKPPGKFADVAGGGGWLPAERGLLREVISAAADGGHFKSKLHYEASDTAGQPIEGGGEADGAGEPIEF